MKEETGFKMFTFFWSASSQVEDLVFKLIVFLLSFLSVGVVSYLPSQVSFFPPNFYINFYCCCLPIQLICIHYRHFRTHKEKTAIELMHVMWDYVHFKCQWYTIVNYRRDVRQRISFDSCHSPVRWPKQGCGEKSVNTLECHRKV